MADKTPEIIAQHTVQKGETLSHIALKYYGSAIREKWMVIYEANRDTIGDNPSWVRPGTVLKIPEWVEPEKPPLGKGYMARYRTKPGDTLSHIALWYYGSAIPTYWGVIYEANQDLIGDNPNRLRAGLELKIPELSDPRWRMRSRKPAHLSLHNRTKLTVSVYWVDYDEREVLRATLAPGQSQAQRTYLTHTFVIRDSESQREIATVLVESPDAEFDITDQGLWSLPGAPATAVFINNTPLDVVLCYVDENGKESRDRPLEAGKEHTEQTHELSVWRAFQSDTREEIGLFIVSADARRQYRISFEAYKGHPATTIEFTNNSLFTLGLYWKINRGEKLVKTLQPLEVYEQLTFETHAWVVREVSSGRAVASVVAGSEAKQVFIQPDMLRSKSGEVIRKLEIHNAAPFALTLYKIMANGERDLVVENLAAGETFSNNLVKQPGKGVSAARREYANYTNYYTQDVFVACEALTGQDVCACVAGPERQQRLEMRPRAYRLERNSSVEISNQTLLTLSIGWLNESGEENGLPGELAPGAAISLPAPVSRLWIVREAASRQLVDCAITGWEKLNLAVTGKFVRALADEQPVSVQVRNQAPFAVDVYDVDHEGEEGEPCLRSLAPGEQRSYKTFATHPLRARERDSRMAVAAYIAKPAQEHQRFEILLKSSDEATTTINFVNQTPLTLELSSFGSNGVEFVADTLGPRQSLEVGSRVATPWVARDLHSKRVIALAIGRHAAQTVVVDAGDLRSRPSEGPVQVSFSNPTVFSLDIHHIDPAGDEKRIGEMQPGEDLQLETFAGQVYRFSERESGELFYIFITSEQAGQTCEIQDTLILRQERPNKELYEGEVALYEDGDYAGNVWILRNGFANFSLVGLDERISSIKLGPNTGATLFTEPDYDDQKGRKDDFYLDSPSLKMTEVGEDRVSSMKVWKIVSYQAAGISSQTSLSMSYRMLADKKGEPRLVEFPSYRSVLSFPQGTHEVDIWATEKVAILVGGQNYEIDENNSVRLKPNAISRLIVDIEAKELATPALKVHTNRMAYHERALVFPDEYVYQRMANLSPGELRENRKALGIPDKYNDQTVDDIQSAIQNLARSVRYAAEPPDQVADDRQVNGDNMEYRRWSLDLDPDNPDARYRPLRAEDIQALAQQAPDQDMPLAEIRFDWVKEAWDGFVAEVVGPAIELTVKIGREVVRLMLKTAKKVGEFLQNVWEQIGVGWNKFMEWLDAFFDWSGILETHDALMALVNNGLDQVGGVLDRAKEVLISYLTTAGEEVNRFFRNLEERLGIAGMVPKRKQEESLLAKGMQEVMWLLSEFCDYLPSLSVGPSLSVVMLGTPENATAHQFDDMITRLVESGVDLADDVIDALQASSAYLMAAVEQPSKFPELVIGALLNIARAIALAGIELVRVLIGVIFDLAMMLLKSFNSLINMEIKIPLISAFYEKVIGRKLSILSIICLVIGAPLAVISKLTLGRKPKFVEEQDEAELKQTWGITYSVCHYVLFITSAASLASEAGFIGITSLIVGFIAQMGAHPRGYIRLDEETFNSAIPQKDIDDCTWVEKPIELFKIIWLFQWFQWSVDLAVTVMSSGSGQKTTKDGQKSTKGEGGFDKGSKVVQTVLGAAQLALYIFLVIYDLEKIDQAMALVAQGRGDEKDAENARYSGSPWIRKSFGNMLTTLTPIASAFAIGKIPTSIALAVILITMGQIGEATVYIHRTLHDELF